MHVFLYCVCIFLHCVTYIYLPVSLSHNSYSSLGYQQVPCHTVGTLIMETQVRASDPLYQYDIIFLRSSMHWSEAEQHIFRQKRTIATVVLNLDKTKNQAHLQLLRFVKEVINLILEKQVWESSRHERYWPSSASYKSFVIGLNTFLSDGRSIQVVRSGAAVGQGGKHPVQKSIRSSRMENVLEIFRPSLEVH